MGFDHIFRRATYQKKFLSNGYLCGTLRSDWVYILCSLWVRNSKFSSFFNIFIQLGPRRLFLPTISLLRPAITNVVICWRRLHWVKSVQIRSFLWSVFSCIRTDKEIYGVNLHIQSEHRKITKKLRTWTLFMQCLWDLLYYLLQVWGPEYLVALL